jgi:hypothetical protein
LIIFDILRDKIDQEILENYFYFGLLFFFLLFLLKVLMKNCKNLVISFTFVLNNQDLFLGPFCILKIDGKGTCGIVSDLCCFLSYFVKFFAHFNSNILAHDNWCLKSNFEALFVVDLEYLVLFVVYDVTFLCCEWFEYYYVQN